MQCESAQRKYFCSLHFVSISFEVTKWPQHPKLTFPLRIDSMVFVYVGQSNVSFLLSFPVLHSATVSDPSSLLSPLAFDIDELCAGHSKIDERFAARWPNRIEWNWMESMCCFRNRENESISTLLFFLAIRVRRSRERSVDCWHQ